MKSAISVITLSVLLLLGAPVSYAGGEDASVSLYALISDIHSLSSEFEQRISDRDNILLQESSGKFSLQRPSLIYWKTLPPYEQEIIGDGSTLWVYDADLEQVTQYPNGELLKGPMALFSNSLEDVRERFHVSLQAIENTEGLVERYILVPKSSDIDEGFAEIVFEFRGTELGAIEIKDRLQQRTTLSLKNLESNPSMPESTFQFTPPEGVDVLINE